MEDDGVRNSRNKSCHCGGCGVRGVGRWDTIREDINRNNCLKNLEAGKFWRILQLPPSIPKPCNMWLWRWQPMHLACPEAAGLNNKFFPRIRASDHLGTHVGVGHCFSPLRLKQLISHYLAGLI